MSAREIASAMARLGAESLAAHMTLSPAQRERLLAKIRKICLALPETSERLSQSEPAFFFREKKSFLTMDTYHHGSRHYSAWVAAPMGSQELLVRSDPENFFVPPYVGHRGWVGVILVADPDWDQVASVIADGYAQVAEGRRR